MNGPRGTSRGVRAGAALSILVASLVASLVAPAGAEAKPAPAPVENGQNKLALAPLTALTDDQKGVAAVEERVVQGLSALPGWQIVSASDVRKAIRKAKRQELEACEGNNRCLAEVGRLVGATIVVAGDVSPIADGSVVYLKAVDATSEKETGSTTAVLEGADPAKQAEARAAAFRLLNPKAYVGRLTLEVDVANATVYIDGQKAAFVPGKPLQLAVGTHALRVTHEQYRDFVRFVDVKFDEDTDLKVGLTAFPVISDEMHQKRRPRPAGPVEPLPWYRKWWAVAGFGTVVVVGATVLVYALSGGLDVDDEVTVGAP